MTGLAREVLGPQPSDEQSLQSLIALTKLRYFIGFTIGTFCHGILLTLCFMRIKNDSSKQRLRFLQVYVCIILVVNMVFEINNARVTGIMLLYDTDPSESPGHIFITPFDALVVCIAIMTDGLLVWRCYLVQKSLSAPRSNLHWTNLGWIFPGCLLIAEIAASVASLTTKIPKDFSQGMASSEVILLVTCFVSNALLNVYVTCNIVIRLLLHRRRVAAASLRVIHGSKEPHMRVVGMLLEAAALNVPISIVTAVAGAMVNSLASMAFQIVVPIQSIASVLIIYQVARGRAVGEDTEHWSRSSTIPSRDASDN
ncbi:hypothetical protein P691DRAFT_785295 [Macrolepiota fuliginosa MF-IS2]|uniref:G protein-coupled receptor n=1 Tax=Macrolepiota fuliginosa MF-IS2 TaxID=1400762 RepID=A0A9P6C1H1_9AGAR|nr:hypothetical protein P691DRAFT_785295 [Macrolepiota fuliginosa MF-IS2]